jgi:hypothetical protein
MLVSSRKTSAKPAGIWEVMTPELPRAHGEPRLIAWHTSGMDSAVPSSAHTDSSVSAMFVPVSPSGTG